MYRQFSRSFKYLNIIHCPLNMPVLWSVPLHFLSLSFVYLGCQGQMSHRITLRLVPMKNGYVVFKWNIRGVRSEHKVRTYKEYHSGCPSSELGLPPTPHPQASVPPPPCFWGEGNTRWRERGWESPNSDEGHTLWYSLYVRTLWLRVKN